MLSCFLFQIPDDTGFSCFVRSLLFFSKERNPCSVEAQMCHPLDLQGFSRTHSFFVLGFVFEPNTSLCVSVFLFLLLISLFPMDLLPLVSDYPTSVFAVQAPGVARRGAELAATALKVIDDLLFNSDACEILRRKPSSGRTPSAHITYSPDAGQKEVQRLVLGTVVEHGCEEENKNEKTEDDGEDTRRSIKRLTTFIMTQLATRPVDRATVSAMASGWNRRRSSTAISILSAMDVIRGMGVADGFKRLLVLNKNLVILSAHSKTLLSYYAAMKQMEALLQKQVDDMLTLLSSFHTGLDKEALAPPPKRARSFPASTTPVFYPPTPQPFGLLHRIKQEPGIAEGAQLVFTVPHLSLQPPPTQLQAAPGFPIETLSRSRTNSSGAASGSDPLVRRGLLSHPLPPPPQPPSPSQPFVPITTI